MDRSIRSYYLLTLNYNDFLTTFAKDLTKKDPFYNKYLKSRYIYALSQSVET